jgi:SagB-type dehydrogenase family enzyme
VPSAGGLYALRLVVADLGEGAPARGAGTVWAALSPGESEAMAEAFFGSVAGPHCVVVFAGAPEAPVLRYGARGYRYLLLEAGHCAQELLRAAQAIGLHSCPLGAFDDQALSALLRLDWSGEIPLFAVAIGRAAGS